MKTRALGKTGLVVSEIGFGCWQMGGNMWGPIDEDEAIRALHAGFDLGINFLDTALVYGNGRSESILRRFLSELGPERTSGIVLSSKIPPKNREWPARDTTAVAEAFPPAHIRTCVEESLKNLGVERIHVMHLHVWAGAWADDASSGWHEAMRGLVKEGKIGHVAISLNAHEPDTGLRAIDKGLAEVVQVVYNVFESIAEDELLPAAARAATGIVARVPFDEGSLTGALRADMKFAADDFRSRYFAGARLAEAIARAERVRDETQGECESLAEAALRFCLSNPAVSTVIPGMRRAAHVRENARASDRGPLSKRLIERLRAHRWVPPR